MNHFTHLRELLLVWIGILASNTLYGNGTVTCPGGRNLTASEGILMSPGYSETHYPNSTVCIWVITAPQHWKVKLMINSVDLEYCAMCSCDYVELRDGAKTSGPLIGRYCEAKASTVYSEGRHMWVKFKSDRENEGRGFLANYTFIKLRKKKPVILKANRTSQFITSSKNPTVCGSDRQCTWVITAPEGFQVQLTTESFVFLSCLGSFIEIKDGPTCSSPMIGKFCGNEKPPLEICSLGNSLWISFKYNSTRDLEMNRFELMYRATRANITPQRKFYDEQAINSDGERLCSCYTFSKNQWEWPIARDSCKSNNKTLVVMESEEEWQFITNEIQNKTGNPRNEWFIGLKKNSTTRRWTWINGKSVTIDKWYKEGNNPDPDDSYGMISKEYPKGFKGSFGTFRGYLQRGWICEEEAATCQGICFVHPVPTSTSPPKTLAGTKAVTTQGKTSSELKSNTLSALLTVQTSPTTTFPVVTKVDDLKKDTNCFSHYLAIAILSAFLFIVMIILAVVLIMLRKKQHEIASRNKAVKTSQRDFQESLAINTLNIGPRLEFASRNRTGIERLHREPLVQQEGVYTTLSPESMTTSENDGSRTYTSLVKSTEDSDIEYVNQITAAEYVNIY